MANVYRLYKPANSNPTTNPGDLYATITIDTTQQTVNIVLADPTNIVNTWTGTRVSKNSTANPDPNWRPCKITNFQNDYNVSWLDSMIDAVAIWDYNDAILMKQGPRSTSATEVVVVNTPQEPIPVAAQGVTEVEVTNATIEATVSTINRINTIGNIENVTEVAINQEATNNNVVVTQIPTTDVNVVNSNKIPVAVDGISADISVDTTKPLRVIQTTTGFGKGAVDTMNETGELKSVAASYKRLRSKNDSSNQSSNYTTNHIDGVQKKT